jgi:hypothetical protein
MLQKKHMNFCFKQRREMEILTFYEVPINNIIKFVAKYNLVEGVINATDIGVYTKCKVTSR